MTHVYHLDLDRSSIADARVVLLPGDPDRVPRLAREIDGDAREIAHRREFRSWLARVRGRTVLVTSTGIGGPSASIAVDELARLGIETFLRVGTTGSIQPGLAPGDAIITAGAVRNDGASVDYAPIEYPAVAHHEVIAALIEAARAAGRRHHVGVSVSSATFYPGEEREDSFTGYVPRRARGATEEWRNLRALNYEMEAATVLTLCSIMGLRGGCVTGVVNRAGEPVRAEGLEAGEAAAIEVARGAIDRLIEL